MNYYELQKLFVEVVKIIVPDVNVNIRLGHAPNLTPGWKKEEDVISIHFYTDDDQYARQRNSTFEYDPNLDTTIKVTSRTIVWKIIFIVYGPNSCSNVNALQDGFFLQSVKRLTNPKNIFIVPELNPPFRAPEEWAGSWWERWDLKTVWNELRIVREDVGKIQDVPISIYSEHVSTKINVEEN